MRVHRSSKHRPSNLSRRRQIVAAAVDRRLRVEQLEDRRMLAVITVDTAADTFDGSILDGDISLRDAVHAANNLFDLDTINFDPVVFATPQTIALSLGEIEITETIAIDATTVAQVTIDAQQNSRIFNITATFGDFMISGLTLTGGRTFLPGSDGTGGAVSSLTNGNLTINRSTINGNSTLGNGAAGGGVFSNGAVTLTHSTVSGNSTTGISLGPDGGGIRSGGDVTLINSIVSGNHTEGNSADGGGIHSFGDVTLTNSTVIENHSEGNFSRGGGIRSGGTLTLTNSTVIGNHTEGVGSYGGGVFSAGAVTLTNSTVSGNHTEGDSSRGGGVRSGGAVTLTDSTVSQNYTAGGSAEGGGISSVRDVALTNSTVSGNITAGDGGRGGGISALNGVTLILSTVSGNRTEGTEAYGAGVFANGSVTLTQSTVSNNMTLGMLAHGGGIRAGGVATITNSTVSGNRTQGQDALFAGVLALNDVTVEHSTITDNHAQVVGNIGGAGLWNNDDTVMIRNSIIAGNTGSGPPDISPGTGVLDVDYSLIGVTTNLTTQQLFDLLDGNGNKLDQNAMLNPLAFNGGPTQTHAPMTGSPVINAGDPFIVAPPDSDQRGAPFDRIVGGRIDIGAVEDQPIPDSADFDVDVDVDGADFLRWQRGVGTPNADLPDGDANNDNLVNATDLSIWEGQYSNGSQLAASSTVVRSVSAVLIDAAIAATWLEAEGQKDHLPIVDDQKKHAPETVDKQHIFTKWLMPTGTFEQKRFLPDEADWETNIDTQWLAEELLEIVFGRG